MFNNPPPSPGLKERIIEDLLIAGITATCGWLLEHILGPKIKKYFQKPEDQEKKIILIKCPNEECQSEKAYLVDSDKTGISLECIECNNKWDIKKKDKYRSWE